MSNDEINEQNYPPNNEHQGQHYKEQEAKKETRQKILDELRTKWKEGKGELAKEKKSWLQSTASWLFAEDIDDVWVYVRDTIIKPSIIRTISDSLHGSIDVGFYGRGGSGSRSSQSPSRVSTGNPSYNEYYKNQSSANVHKLKQSDLLAVKATDQKGAIDLNKLIFKTREGAVFVLDGLLVLLENGQYATVGDLCYILEIDHSYIDNDWLWTDLSKVSPEPYSFKEEDTGRYIRGYKLSLPEPVHKNRL